GGSPSSSPSGRRATAATRRWRPTAAPRPRWPRPSSSSSPAPGRRHRRARRGVRVLPIWAVGRRTRLRRAGAPPTPTCWRAPVRTTTTKLLALGTAAALGLAACGGSEEDAAPAVSGDARPVQEAPAEGEQAEVEAEGE